jgi:predicted permease
MRLDTQWHGLERLTYYVLFPMLLIQSLVKADLTKVPVGGVGGALFLSALAMSLLCLVLRPALDRFDIGGPAFTSIFQGATRWQTYVALSVSANLFGDAGLALASVAMVAIIPLVNVLSVGVLAHYASPEKQSARAIVMTVVRNPLIWACLIGLVVTCRCRGSGTKSLTRSAAPRSPSACSSPARACISKACSAEAWAQRSASSSSWC